MTLKEAVEKFETQFRDVVPFDRGGSAIYAPNGKPFVVVMGLNPASWLKEATHFAGKHSILFWRIKPVAEYGRGIYSRFATGDDPCDANE